MRIEQSITELLYRYQCVTVPGFGAFLTETISSQYFPATQTFSPPKKLVSFNLHIKNNDGLLANHLAQKERVSYEVALRFIAIVVEEWMQVLNHKKTLEFEKIGKIELSSENNLVFTPFDVTNFNLQSFGLLPVQSKNVFRIIAKEPTVEILEVISENEVQSEIFEENTEAIHTHKKSIPWLRYAASFVIFASVTAAISGYFYQQNVAQETKIVSQKVQQKVEQKIQEATFFIENPLPAITVTISQPKHHYHIVGGAFKTYENAEKFSNILLNAGFESKVGEINKYGLFPVFYGSYATNDEAIEALENIKSNQNKDAWILFEE
ncbi:MAG: SPOR domain-containing protein [Flavobacterium sp.]